MYLHYSSNRDQLRYEVYKANIKAFSLFGRNILLKSIESYICRSEENKMGAVNRNSDTEIGINVKPESNNKVNKEVQRIFFPMNLMQILVLNPKYRIRNNFINPNNCFNKFILLCGALLFLASHIHHILDIVLDVNVRRYSQIRFLIFATTFDVSFNCLGFVMNLTVNLIHSKKSVLFVLHFQEVHRFLSYNTSCIILRNWLSVASIFAFYIFITVYDNFFILKPPWKTALFKIILVSIDANLIYALRLIALLTCEIELWNYQLSLVQKNGCSKLRAAKLFQAYDKIFKCYKLIKNIYQLPVSRKYCSFAF